MKIGICHLTDLHFTTKTDLGPKLNSLARGLINDFYGVARIYLVVSGDISNSGKEEEFERAKSFLNRLKFLLSTEFHQIPVQLIIIPGNHDCNFDFDSQLRRNTIQSINYNSLGNDSSVINQCLVVQDTFWEFYKNYNRIPENKLYY